MITAGRKKEIENRIKDLHHFFSVDALSLISQISRYERSEAEIVKKVVSLIEKDPGLATFVLKVANSPFYGLPRKISSVHDAVLLMGVSTIKTVIVAYWGSQIVQSEGKETLNHLTWTSSFAKQLAKKIESFVSVSYFELSTAALLHDVGKVILKNLFKKKWASFIEARSSFSPCSNEKVLSLERTFFGMDHAEVGARVAELWSFPEFLVEAIKAHHDPFSSVRFRNEALVVSVSDLAYYRVNDLIDEKNFHELVNKLVQSVIEKKEDKEFFLQAVEETMKEENLKTVYEEGLLVKDTVNLRQ
jgi:putative nucleotidyltransferase with HDIG domain